MKLKDNFFEIKNFSEKDGLEFVIKLNSRHPIYQAHFPGNPITPGVCVIQIVKELTEEYFKSDFRIKKVIKVKFSNTINPIPEPEVIFKISVSEIENGNKKISATVINATDTVFSKLTLELE